MRIGKYFIGQDYSKGTTLYRSPIPPAPMVRGIINCYEKVPILNSAVHKRAESIAGVQWRLYQVKSDGSRREITKHPLVDLWNHPNQLQGGYQFRKSWDINISLFGEMFATLNFKGRLISEMYIMSPEFIEVIPGTDRLIEGYAYKPPNGPKQKLTFEQVFRDYEPSASNPYRGLGWVGSLLTVADTEYMAQEHQRRVLYNGASLGLVVTVEGNPSKDEVDRMQESLRTTHSGWVNAAKNLFLSGGAKVSNIGMTNREMDFYKLRLLGRDVILSAAHIPLSVMGITENVNRANAEAGEYTFAKGVEVPNLERMKNAANNFLCPLYGDYLELDYESPVPDDRAAVIQEIGTGVTAGYMMIDEARQARGDDPLPNDRGRVLLWPMSAVPQDVDQKKVATPPQPAKRKSIFGEEQKLAYWKDYTAKIKPHSEKLSKALAEMFSTQRTEAERRFRAGQDVYVKHEAIEEYKKVARPLMTEQYLQAMKDSRKLVKQYDEDYTPEVKHKIDKRLLFAAASIVATIYAILSKQISLGESLNESPDQIMARINGVFNDCIENRSDLIANTESSWTANAGAIDGYKDAGIEDVEWFAAGPKPCDDCEGNNGWVMPVDDAEGMLPAHPNCFCILLPVRS